MKIEIQKLKTPTSLIGSFILFALGIYIATASQLSVGKKDGSPAKEVSVTYRITIGIALILLGGIIFFTHFKKQE